MEQLRITGGAGLRGEVGISGSKNATLPLLAASLLTDQAVELRNVPAIEDIETMAAMLRHLGATAERTAPGVWQVHAAAVSPPLAPGSRPWFAIGGIELGNIDQIVAAGARRVVVVRAITEADDPAAATRALVSALRAPSSTTAVGPE